MDAKDEIKQKLSVEEVIGDYLELKRAGRNFKASSPFSSERTPSFMVSPEKQIWHDFSSNKGGDMFSFIMEVEGVDFREALEILAKKANVDLTSFHKKGDGERTKLKKRMQLATSDAVLYYHLCLSKYAPALNYIKTDRHFTSQTIRTWQLGYSPEDGTSLYHFLKKRGYTEKELSSAGLITKRRGSWSDMFRGRIMIPLSDGQGNTVGFTARLLKKDDNAPKYFNTPQTMLYDKGRQVFGLHHAKEAVRKLDMAVIVEGNLDVIASHQADVRNVVAAAGTAMTADHLRSLSRLSLNVRLAFDADNAGLNATERAIAIAQTVGVDLKVVTMPDGIKDPDELIQSDAKMWNKQIEQASDAVTWILHRYESQYDKSSAEGKRQLSGKALEVISGLKDPVEREHHIRSLAKNLDISISSLVAKLQLNKKPLVPKKPHKVQAIAADSKKYEDDFLAVNMFFTEVRDSLSVVKNATLSTPDRESVKSALLSLTPGSLVSLDTLHKLNINQDYGKILLLTAEEKYASWTPADIMAEAMALARRIVTKRVVQSKNELTEAIRLAEEAGNFQKAAELLDNYQQLLKGE